MMTQIQDENDQLHGENKQLRKKVDSQKKQLLGELMTVKTLRKEIRVLQEKLQETPSSSSHPRLGKEEKQDMELKLEVKYMEKYDKYRQQLQD